jgi:hypothetical protein
MTNRTGIPFLVVGVALACSNRLDVGAFTRPDAGAAPDARDDTIATDMGGPDREPERAEAGPDGRPDLGITSACTGGTTSSSAPRAVSLADGVVIKALLTAGDAVGAEGGAPAPYRLVGLPSGLGLRSSKDKSAFHLFVNHELPATAGRARAHGAQGAFVSRWAVVGCDLSVLAGEDLMRTVNTWDAMARVFRPSASNAFDRLGDGELPPPSALHDPASGTGFEDPLFLGGESGSREGRAWAHELGGTSWRLPALGKMEFGGLAVRPLADAETAVATADRGGRLYLYLGKKRREGSSIERAGLADGQLFTISVAGFDNEGALAGQGAAVPFAIRPIPNAESLTSAGLEIAAAMAGVTRFSEPSDVAWDPSHPDELYFVTASPGRLWRMRFKGTNARVGGTIEVLLAGGEGPRALRNVLVDGRGHAYLQEGGVRPGNPPPRIWRYDSATDKVTPIARVMGDAFQITQVEETSGMIDASELLGGGWFLLSFRRLVLNDDKEMVSQGQLLALFDPAAM